MRGFILERFGCHINRDDTVFLNVKGIIAEDNLNVKALLLKIIAQRNTIF